MFDKKDPPQASVNAASQEDDDIIDLTEEVVINAEEDNGIIELTEDLDEDTPTADDKDKSFEDEEDEGVTGLVRTDKNKPHDDDVTFDPDHHVTGHEGTMGEDRIIASAIAESQEPEADEDQKLTEEFDRNALEDDDVVIVDNMPDEMDEGLTGMTGSQTGDTQRDEDLFDLEEKIELEYELDEDEDELIALDDERADDNQDFVDIVLSESTESDRSDHSDEPAELLEHDPAEPDNVIALDADRESEPEMIAAADDKAPEFVDNDDLSDLETVTGFEFEDDEDIVALTDEEPPEFESDEGLLDLDDATDLDDDDVIIPLEGFDNLATDNEDDIIEITEFDEHFPAADETLLEQTGMLDVSGAEEEDFLELIEVEEDNLSQDEDIKDFDDTAEKDEYSEVDRILSGGLEEDELRGVATEPIFSKVFEDNKLEKENNASISSDVLEGNEPEDEALEPIFGDASGDEDGPEEEIIEGAEEVLAANQESAAETETPFSEDEDFEFNVEPGAISRQVDRLDTFLSEDSANEPDAASLHEGQIKEEAEESVPKDLQARPDPDEFPAVTPGQIDAAVERVISQQFSDRIEDIIYKVIEKAVAKEIDRLKRALLENDTIEDSR